MKKQRRMTKNKKEILGVFEKEHLLTERELARLLPKIDKSVIYRNLKALVEDGVLLSVHLTSEVAYELAQKANHDHFICDECHTVEAVHLPKEKVFGSVGRDKRVRQVEVLVHGVCAECK